MCSLEQQLLLLTLGMRSFAMTLVFFVFLQEAAVVGFVEPAVGEQLQYPAIVTLSVWPFHLLVSTTEQRRYLHLEGRVHSQAVTFENLDHSSPFPEQLLDVPYCAMEDDALGPGLAL